MVQETYYIDRMVPLHVLYNNYKSICTNCALKYIKQTKSVLKEKVLYNNINISMLY